MVSQVLVWFLPWTLDHISLVFFCYCIWSPQGDGVAEVTRTHPEWLPRPEAFSLGDYRQSFQLGPSNRVLPINEGDNMHDLPQRMVPEGRIIRDGPWLCLIEYTITPESLEWPFTAGTITGQSLVWMSLGPSLELPSSFYFSLLVSVSLPLQNFHLPH